MINNLINHNKILKVLILFIIKTNGNRIVLLIFFFFKKNLKIYKFSQSDSKSDCNEIKLEIVRLSKEKKLKIISREFIDFFIYIFKSLNFNVLINFTIKYK